MRIINCAKTSVRVETYLNRWRDISWKSKFFDNWADIDWHQEQDAVEIRVIAERDNGAFKQFLFDSRLGPHTSLGHGYEPYQIDYPNTHVMVINAHTDHRLVDWTNVRNKHLGLVRQLPEDGGADDLAMDIVEGTALAIVAGLATGLSAAGAAFAPAAGLTAGLGGALLMAVGLTDPQPPPPPKLEEIEKTVQAVVNRALIKQEAERAASLMGATATKFTSLTGDAYDRIIAGGHQELSDHELEDLESFIHEVVNSVSEGTVYYTLHHLSQHPEISKFMLMPLLVGVGTYLQAYRLHLIILNTSKQNGKNLVDVPLTSIGKYRDEFSSQLDSLKSARASFETYLADEVRKEYLDDTTVEPDLRGLITRSIHGTSSLDSFDEAIRKLEDARDALDRDIQAGVVTAFWNTSALEQAPT